LIRFGASARFAGRCRRCMVAALRRRGYGLGSTACGRWREYMTVAIILTGDINLMTVTDPSVPFALVRDALRDADLVFSNLECWLYRPASGHSPDHEGFFADPDVAGEALASARVAGVGIANNVNYGEGAINASISRLDRLGIGHTGAGENRAAARAP